MATLYRKGEHAHIFIPRVNAIGIRRARIVATVVRWNRITRFTCNWMIFAVSSRSCKTPTEKTKSSKRQISLPLYIFGTFHEPWLRLMSVFHFPHPFTIFTRIVPANFSTYILWHWCQDNFIAFCLWIILHLGAYRYLAELH